jgi:hypothetical protein
MTDRTNGSLAAFVAMAFAIVGLTGFFATYAVPLPLQRAAARELALDDALAAARSPDPGAAISGLAGRLGDSAEALVGPPETLPQRIEAERHAMRARFTHEAEVIATRVRWLIAIVTIMAAVFAIVMLSRGRSRS